MVYPHKWSPISYRSSAGQRKHAGQRPMFYRWTMQPRSVVSWVLWVVVNAYALPREFHCLTRGQVVDSGDTCSDRIASVMTTGPGVDAGFWKWGSSGSLRMEVCHWGPWVSPSRRSVGQVPPEAGDILRIILKGKGFPYSIPRIGPGADPGVQAVSLQVTVGHPPGSRLPLLPARPAVTFPAAEHHRPLAGTKLYCLVTETHYAVLPRVGFEPPTYWSQSPTLCPLRIILQWCNLEESKTVFVNLALQLVVLYSDKRSGQGGFIPKEPPYIRHSFLTLPSGWAPGRQATQPWGRFEVRPNPCHRCSKGHKNMSKVWQ